MKALSIRQPWAQLIVHHGKDIENRTWKTNFRGRVLVHASKSGGLDEFFEAQDFRRSAGIFLYQPLGGLVDLPRGGIVGSVEIVDCVQESRSPWFCGPWGFVLRNPEPLPFEPCRGRLGFFDVESRYDEERR